MKKLCDKCLGYGIYEDVGKSIFGHTEYYCICSIGKHKKKENDEFDKLFRHNPAY